MQGLSNERIGTAAGFGMVAKGDGYWYRPTSIEGIFDVFDEARRSGRKVVQRGSGRSYGDAALLPEGLILDLRRMNNILAWDPDTGLITAEAGVTIEQIWRHTLEDGWWPPVVSGTMFPTLGGALAMNIHGKNAYCKGPIGEHVTELEFLTPNGQRLTLRPDDVAFYEAISSAGLLGVITRATLQMKRVSSGDLRVLPLSCADWEEQFACMERFEGDADYMVGWVDAFAKGKSCGRGLFHAAWYLDEPAERPSSLRVDQQDLPDTILGFFPKSMVWRYLKRLNNRWGMRNVNWAKYTASRLLGHGKPHPQSLVAFSFLLDYVPNWQRAYLPGGFIQYQSFVPKESAHKVFAEQLRMQQEARLESFLAVFKRHRPDRFLLSHGVDGYSLALDFKVTERNWPDVQRLAHRMNDLVLEAGGRFYLAKDATLRPEDARAYLGEETLARLRARKAEWDPEGLLSSAQAERLGLA